MATFISWTAELQRFKDALANQPPEMLLKAGYTGGNGNTVTFKRYEDIHLHLNFLESKAATESTPSGKRRMLLPIGYGGRV